MLGGVDLALGEIENGGEEVELVDEGGGFFSGRDAGASDNGGDADAAFIDFLFAAFEGEIIGEDFFSFELGSSVIGSEEEVGGFDELLAGVSGVVGVLEHVHDAAEAPVDRGRHGGEVGVLLARKSDRSGLGWEGLAEFLAVVFEELAIAGEHGPVDHPVAEVEEERFFAFGLDELQGFFSEFVVGVGDALGEVL